MIIKDQPSAVELFFTMQGSIVPKIRGKILGVALISVAILVVDQFLFEIPQVPIAAMGVFGVALSLFLGFRNNAAYDRWWEGRKLWGGMIADARTLGRDVRLFTQSDQTVRQLLKWIPAFAHFHRGHLRNSDVTDVVSTILGADHTQSVAAFANPADAVLRLMTDEVATLSRANNISGFGQMRISETLNSLGLAQAGCERIANTPLPFVYSLLVRRTTYLYCWLLPFALISTTNLLTPLFAAIVAYVFFGLQAVTNELEMPFEEGQNSLPLDAMCRTIEISIAEAMGDTPPPPLLPQGFILS